MLAAADTLPQEIKAEFTVTPKYGEPFQIYTIENDESDDSQFIYTNIMAVRGVEKRDEHGEIIYADNNMPEIGGVEIKTVEGVPLVTYAFSEWFGPAAGKVLSIAVLLFAFSTVIGWSFYGTRSMEYLLGKKAARFYQGIFVLFIIVGAMMELGLAFQLSDTFNGLMAIPNLIGVLLLSGSVIRITKNYKERRFRGADVKPVLSAYPDIQRKQEDKLNRIKSSGFSRMDFFCSVCAGSSCFFKYSASCLSILISRFSSTISDRDISIMILIFDSSIFSLGSGFFMAGIT